MLLDAVELAGARPPPDLPPGPPFFRFSADDEFAGLLHQAGLGEIEIRTLAFTQRLSGPDAMWRGLVTGTIRTGPLVLWQTPETQERIRMAFDRLLDEYAGEGGIELPVSVKVTSGHKAS